MLHCGKEDLSSSVPSCGGVCVLASAGPRRSIMEPLDLLENGNSPQQRKSQWQQVALYTSVLVMVSALVPVVFCLLYHKQALESCWAHGSYQSQPEGLGSILSWEWSLEHCEGWVQPAQQRYLSIQQGGRYFVYAQVSRIRATQEAFTLTLYKEPGVVLSKAVGPSGSGSGTVHLGRPFLLREGDKLYCRANTAPRSILGSNQTYWGLYRL